MAEVVVVVVAAGGVDARRARRGRSASPRRVCRELRRKLSGVVRGPARSCACLRRAGARRRARDRRAVPGRPSARAAALRRLVDAGGARARPPACVVAELTGTCANELYRADRDEVAAPCALPARRSTRLCARNRDKSRTAGYAGDIPAVASGACPLAHTPSCSPRSPSVHARPRDGPATRRHGRARHSGRTRRRRRRRGRRRGRRAAWPAPPPADPWRSPLRGRWSTFRSRRAHRSLAGPRRGVDLSGRAGAMVRAACTGRVAVRRAGAAARAGGVAALGPLVATSFGLGRAARARGARVDRGHASARSARRPPAPGARRRRAARRGYPIHSRSSPLQASAPHRRVSARPRARTRGPRPLRRRRRRSSRRRRPRVIPSESHRLHGRPASPSPSWHPRCRSPASVRRPPQSAAAVAASRPLRLSRRSGAQKTH